MNILLDSQSASTLMYTSGACLPSGNGSMVMLSCNSTSFDAAVFESRNCSGPSVVTTVLFDSLDDGCLVGKPGPSLSYTCIPGGNVRNFAGS